MFKIKCMLISFYCKLWLRHNNTDIVGGLHVFGWLIVCLWSALLKLREWKPHDSWSWHSINWRAETIIRSTQHNHQFCHNLLCNGQVIISTEWELLQVCIINILCNSLGFPIWLFLCLFTVLYILWFIPPSQFMFTFSFYLQKVIL